jgi:hypothetical protein
MATGSRALATISNCHELGFVVVQSHAVKMRFLFIMLHWNWALDQEFFILTKFKTMMRVLDHALC